MAKKPEPNAGDDVLIGTEAKDRLVGGAGADRLHGRGGDDRLEGADGADTLDGGAGDDIVVGGSGDDLLIYVAAENAGARDDYRGGEGADVLRLELGRAEWMNPLFQSDLTQLARYGAEDLRFQAFNLRMSGIEAVEVWVDGVLLSLEDDPVTTGADTLTGAEDDARFGVDVLADDVVPDLVRSVSHGQAAHGRVSMQLSLADVAKPQAMLVYEPATYWQRLGEGEVGQDSFTYSVVDADGDAATATVTVLIQGRNDAPVLLGAESGPLAGWIAFQDVDLSDAHHVAVSGSTSLGVMEAHVVENTLDEFDTGRIDWRFQADDAAFRALGAGQTASQTHTLTLTDPSGAAVSREVTVTLTGVNDDPTAAADFGATEQDVPLAIAAGALLDNDTDPDFGDALSLASVQAARNGTVVLGRDGVVFTPEQGFTGTASFEYVVADQNGGSAVGTVFVEVKPAGAATLLGGEGSDTLDGGSGSEVIFGLEGNDFLSGGGGADTLIGGWGHDWIDGGDGDDVIGMVGEDYGNDTIRGGRGNDHILEGDAADVFLYASGDGNDVIEDRAGRPGPEDILWLTDLDPHQVSLRQSGTSLVIYVRETQERITILDQLGGPPWHGIEKLQFANGTVYTRNNFEAYLDPNPLPWATPDFV